MRFIFKYTWSNIKANALRAVLLVSCIAFASVLFFVSLAFPMYLENYWEGTMRSYFGNSDIYMQSTGMSIGDMTQMPDSMKNNFEYAYGFLALPQSRFSNVSKRMEPITYISGNFADVQAFNPVRILKGSAEGFDDDDSSKAIITQSTAKRFGWSIGDKVRVKVFGGSGLFDIAAIVANEGLLSENNETNGPIMLLSKAGSYEALKNILPSLGASADNLDNYFTMAVFKVKEGVDIPGMASELANIFTGFEVDETVNNEVLSAAVDYLRTPFIACIYLVCAFCALIIYLTCKLTFSERVRQFAVLKSMGATTNSLFGSLLLESCFYGLIGGAVSILFALLQVYCLPLVAPQMTYITPVPVGYYFYAILFGIGIAIISSFVQAFKNARKSIKQTLLFKEKFTKQKLWVSVASSVVFVVAAILLIATRNISFKPLSIPLFLLALFGLIVALPFVLSGAFWIIKKIFPKRTFESLYLEKTLPSKNLSVANRLLFFGLFLVFLCSTLITSLTNLAIVGQQHDYDIVISQVSESAISKENLEEIRLQQGVKYAWEGVKIDDVMITETGKYLDSFIGLNKEDIERIYGNDIINKDKVLQKFTSGKIILNKYYRDSKGFKLGDKISLNVGVKTVQTLEFEVIGFIDNYEQWGDYGVCLLEDVAHIENVEGYNSIFIEVDPSANKSADEIISEIRALPFIGQGENEGGEDEEVVAKFLAFTNVEKQQQIFNNQIKAPLLILRTYSVLVLILSLLCIFIGYVLYLRESSEYHKTLFALGMSPRRFEALIIKQSIFMTVASIVCATVLSALLYFNFENIFNALGTSFTTKVNYFEYSMYALGMLAGTTLMAWGLGAYFKRDLMRGDKRLFG